MSRGAACRLSSMNRAGLHDVMAGHVERGVAPGLVSVVSRQGEADIDVIGRSAVGGPPMRRDSIFRISSMTKPVTAVATMILLEECVVRLDEPVDRLLPELADRRVVRRIDGPVDDTVPAVRPITVEDVLTFRLGWGIIFTEDPLPILKATADLPGFGMPDPRSPLTPDAWMARLGALPLMAQPGERWMYTAGANVLGVLVARAAGQPLDVVFQERILGPLGMVDTGFGLAESERDRLAAIYVPGHDRKAVRFDP
ncbi:MAG: hypothetical protein JWO68_3864, partial [Actinomycetia bacterium]|nr:hypothetical protein [Actinomycetes bacterium]